MSFWLKIRGADEGSWIIGESVGNYSIVFGLRFIAFRSVFCNIGTGLFTLCFLLPLIRSLTFLSSPFFPALHVCVSMSIAVFICAQNIILLGVGLWFVLALSLSSFCLCHSCQHSCIGFINAIFDFSWHCLFSKVPYHISGIEFPSHLISCSA